MSEDKSKLENLLMQLPPKERRQVLSGLLLLITKEQESDVYNWSSLLSKHNVYEEKAAISNIQQSDQSDFQTISGSKLTLSNSYYNNALHQSQQSFTIATSVIIALLGGTGGVGSSAIAYATLQLYKQASEQAAACHIRLDRASDFILANSACEGLGDTEKLQMRSEIIRKLVE